MTMINEKIIIIIIRLEGLKKHTKHVGIFKYGRHMDKKKNWWVFFGTDPLVPSPYTKVGTTFGGPCRAGSRAWADVWPAWPTNHH